MADGERSRLLSDQQNDFTNGTSYGFPNDPQSSYLFPPVSAPRPVMLGEAPPPYSPIASPESSTPPIISCRVCQSAISIEGKIHQHVVKCGICNEATPIKTAPAGKKYVRCPCNCLLICKLSSQKIACPRSYCKRVIHLGSEHAIRSNSPLAQTPVGVRSICGHCSNTFLWTEFSDRTLARCPHCRKVSSFGHRYPRRRALWFFLLFALLSAATAGLMFGTWNQALHNKGIYVAWVVFILLALLSMCRIIHWGCLKISRPIPTVT
ncbi:hypothetical protein UPYG_G00245450 [Umbra pygmaea]|uniref:Phosphatidylinositol-4,5-bisphosphate 4-phosphatase n=1 Tax=Umbra pygmaea TaxID=75934 RepID=A0ABD0WL83_UMBPY